MRWHNNLGRPRKHLGELKSFHASDDPNSLTSF